MVLKNLLYALIDSVVLLKNAPTLDNNLEQIELETENRDKKTLTKVKIKEK